MSGARERMLTVWDDYLAAWLGSPHAPMPPSLARWKDSYHGTGEGAVCDEAMPEPFIGDWFGARLVTLGLNPGAADLPFQARGGHFAKQRVADTGFRHWAKTDPYGGKLWESQSTVNPPNKNGRHVNRYRAARLGFAQAWLTDTGVTGPEVLMVELYPWHSRRVTGSITPPREVLDEFVWEPLRDLDADVVFAFGAPWLRPLHDLGLDAARREHFAGGRFRSAARQAMTFALPSGQELAVVWQSGYAGPPGAADTERLRELLGR